MKEIKAGKWNINAVWAASLSEAEFVDYAKENFQFTEAEAKKAHAEAKKATAKK